MVHLDAVGDACQRVQSVEALTDSDAHVMSDYSCHVMEIIISIIMGHGWKRRHRYRHRHHHCVANYSLFGGAVGCRRRDSHAADPVVVGRAARPAGETEVHLSKHRGGQSAAPCLSSFLLAFSGQFVRSKQIGIGYIEEEKKGEIMEERMGKRRRCPPVA